MRRPRVGTPGAFGAWNTDQGAFRALDAVTSRSCNERDTPPVTVSRDPPNLAESRSAGTASAQLGRPRRLRAQRPPVIFRSRCATPAVPYG